MCERIFHLKDKAPFMLLGIGITLVVAFIDYITGYELGLSLFYLFPIAIVSLFRGKVSGIFVAALGAICWTVSNRIAGKPYSHMFIFYWNMTGRIILFTIFCCYYQPA